MGCGTGSHQEVVWYTRVVSLLFQVTGEEKSQGWMWKQEKGEGEARCKSARRGRCDQL